MTIGSLALRPLLVHMPSDSCHVSPRFSSSWSAESLRISDEACGERLDR